MKAVLLMLLPAVAGAQIDYRNHHADAYPIERHAFEFELPVSLARGFGRTRWSVDPELAYGVLPNAEAAIGLRLDSGGARGVHASAFYNFNSESPLLPAFSLELEALAARGDGPRAGARLLATRSFGRTRLHVNAAHGLERWAAGTMVDRTLLRQSLLLFAGVDGFAPRDASAGYQARAGFHWQWTPGRVLTAELMRGWRNAPRTAISLGVSQAFALPALVPVRPRPHVAGSDPLRESDRRNEQFYYPGAFNWSFLERYPEAARLFNAFDYGHAVLYERLLTVRDSARQTAALAREYDYLVHDLLRRPPRFAIAEEAVMPSYARLAWRFKMMFDWAHVLHRQIYDVYADDGLTRERQRELVERLTDYYLSNHALAFTTHPKSMALMDEQYYSQVFRRRHPSFNGLIWAYHWLQVGLYEPLIAGTTREERRAGVDTALARFWRLLEDAPAQMPTVMPMTSTVAPRFSALHPRAAVIFDNLHMVHDIISDILAADAVPMNRKRDVIYAALEEFRHSSANDITMEAWHAMGEHMGGIDAMGGPPIGPPRGRAPAPPAHRHE